MYEDSQGVRLSFSMLQYGHAGCYSQVPGPCWAPVTAPPPSHLVFLRVFMMAKKNHCVWLRVLMSGCSTKSYSCSDTCSAG